MKKIIHALLRAIAISLFRRYVMPSLTGLINAMLRVEDDKNVLQYIKQRRLLTSMKRIDAIRTVSNVFADINRAIVACIENYGIPPLKPEKPK